MKKQRIIYRFRETRRDDAPWFLVDESGGVFPENPDAFGENDKTSLAFYRTFKDAPVSFTGAPWLGWNARYFEALRVLSVILQSEPPFKVDRDGEPLSFEIEEISPNPATFDENEASSRIF